jgi:hypothetical protein
MLRLALDKAVATLVNFNPSTEKNGTDDVPYSALRISVALGPDKLSYFSPDLKDLLFNEQGPRDLADGMQLRDPHMVFPMKRDEKMENATIGIDYGVNSPMTFPEAKLKDFQLTPNNGGTTVIEFTVTCKPDAYKDVPQLYLLQRKGITLSVTPAELPEMRDAA